MFELRSGDAVAVVDPDRGGRIRQLTIGGLDLLVDEGTGMFDWGLFPMVPFAGRIRHGCFEFAGRRHELPCDAPPHAIHGTLLDVRWSHRGERAQAQLWTTLDHPWPFKGEVRHHLRIETDRMVLGLRVEAAEAMPLTMGWHPWWRRTLAVGGPVEVGVAAGRMYRRDSEGIPTGALIPPPEGPWDDCFTDLGAPPALTWPGAIRLTMEHTCDHLVVYDEPDDAVCIEPQTGPPDAVNLGMASVVEAGAVASAQLTIRWEPA